MSIQKLKKGFTLIELMVVIVIIGILAAIAIPKLFGMSAKAKASELAPAAGTWVKLEVAYALERDNYGSFAKIGYTAPGAGAFTYSGTPEKNEENNDVTWSAKNNDKLNDCVPENEWKISLKFGSPKDNKIEIGGDQIPMIPDQSCLNNLASDADDDAKAACNKPDPDFETGKCSVLTPSFAKVLSVAGP